MQKDIENKSNDEKNILLKLNQSELNKNFNKIPPHVFKVFENSNLIKTISSILDQEHLEILKFEVFSELLLINENTNEIEFSNQSQLAKNMHDFLEDCMIDIEYSIIQEFINKLIHLYLKELKFQKFI